VRALRWNSDDRRKYYREERITEEREEQKGRENRSEKKASDKLAERISRNFSNAVSARPRDQRVARFIERVRRRRRKPPPKPKMTRAEAWARDDDAGKENLGETRDFR